MSESNRKPKGPMGGPGSGRHTGEKAKDFKGSMKKLIRYMNKYKLRVLLMMVFAIGGTIFSIVGPKILGKATTELFNGLVNKINGVGGIDFGKIATILAWVMGLYIVSAVFTYIQGFVMTGFPTTSPIHSEKRSLRRSTESR